MYFVISIQDIVGLIFLGLLIFGALVYYGILWFARIMVKFKRRKHEK